MSETQTSQWLLWAREIQALSQTGTFYAESEFSSQRYGRLSEIAAEIIAAHTELSAPELVADFDATIGYATPRVDVRAAVFRDGQLLMVHERSDGTWSMPGGWADVGDVPSEGAEREVWEETGFKVKTQRVVGVYDANRVEPYSLYHAYKLVFLCDILEGEARTSNETSEVRFFDRADIPLDLLGFRITPRQIEDAFAVLQTPDKPVVFD